MRFWLATILLLIAGTATAHRLSVATVEQAIVTVQQSILSSPPLDDTGYLHTSNGQIRAPTITGPLTTSQFVWPHWARTARIAGAYFHPDNDVAEMDARLDELAAQNVSVVLADSPWGERYEVWADDEKFTLVKNLIAELVQKAHARGLKVVMYQVGLELISDPARNPGIEHPEWAQRGLNGAPILFNDVSNAEEHWLNTGIWDIWLSPCAQEGATSGAFRDLAFARVRDVVETGIDGLWVDQVYLQSSVGSHHDLWPSSDPCSAAAFQTATGLTMPTDGNWDDPIFQRWIIWRHSQIAEFLRAEKAVARAINPQLVFFNENSSVDAGRSTYVANDPTSYLADRDMSTGHEIETIADRMDEGETGMKKASLDQWLAFRTMIAFARGADRGKPSWVLTYGYQPRDSAQMAGFVLAEGANFYETRGPQMADTVGGAFRTRLFNWIAAHEMAFYSGESVAEVGLLYSPRTRDLVDTVSGEPYDVQDSVHFAAYRAVANRLYRAHIPFDVVIDTDIAAFARYGVLIAPEAQAMHDATVAALQEFTGTVVNIGETGLYDEWLTPRATDPLTGANQVRLAQVNKQLNQMADTRLFYTDASPAVQFGIHRFGAFVSSRGNRGYAITIVNTASTPTQAAVVQLRLQMQERVKSAYLSTPEGWEIEIPFTQEEHAPILHLAVPANIDTTALITLMLEAESAISPIN